MKLVLIALSLLSSSAMANYKKKPVTGLVKAEFEVAKFYNNRDHYFPSYTLLREAKDGPGDPEVWNHHIALLTDTNIYCPPTACLYWNQIVTGNSTTHQYREVALQFEIGLTYRNISAFWWHESRHHMEGSVWPKPAGSPFQEYLYPAATERERLRYPLKDYYGIRWCMYGC